MFVFIIFLLWIHHRSNWLKFFIKPHQLALFVDRFNYGKLYYWANWSVGEKWTRCGVCKHVPEKLMNLIKWLNKFFLLLHDKAFGWLSGSGYKLSYHSFRDVCYIIQMENIRYVPLWWWWSVVGSVALRFHNVLDGINWDTLRRCQ